MSEPCMCGDSACPVCAWPQGCATLDGFLVTDVLEQMSVRRGHEPHHLEEHWGINKPAEALHNVLEAMHADVYESHKNGDYARLEAECEALEVEDDGIHVPWLDKIPKAYVVQWVGMLSLFSFFEPSFRGYKDIHRHAYVLCVVFLTEYERVFRSMLKEANQ